MSDEMPGVDLDEVEAILKRQDEAMELLDRLRTEAMNETPGVVGSSDTRREFRRWPAPATVTIELHDGKTWIPIRCTDMGVGGAKVAEFPDWVEGPIPARLKAVPALPVLVLADMMWRDRATGVAGLKFEFFDHEEQDRWAGSLIDALLAAYSVG